MGRTKLAKPYAYASTSKAIIGVDSRGRPITQRHVGPPSKYTPALATGILDAIARFPNLCHACAMHGIVYQTWRYWIIKSKNGRPGDGFDLDYAGRVDRLHVHYDECRDESVQRVEDGYLRRAIGFKETLHHHGRVQYKMDEDLLRLGFEGYEAYLRDENGQPVPESIDMQEPDTMLNVLKHFRPERWTTNVNVDVTHRGGVLVVGVRKTTEELEKTYGGEQIISAIEFVEEKDDDPAA